MPFLNRFSGETDVSVGFLADLSVAVCEGKVPSPTANQIFNESIKPAIPKLSLKLFRSENKQQEPCWQSEYYDKGQKYKESFGQQISRFYCLCRARGFDTEASTILAWLGKEAEIAHITIFPYVLLPFLGSLNKTLKENNIPTSPEIHQVCISVTTKLHTRCLGPEPTKPTTWIREPEGCNNPACESCAKLNRFLQNPTQETELFDKEPEHWSEYTSDLECERPDGYWAPKRILKKTTCAWETKHREWVSRLREVKKRLPSADQVE